MKKTVLFTLLWLMGTLFLTGCGEEAVDVVAEVSPLVEIENEYENETVLYSEYFQEKVSSQLEALKQDVHTLENPLVVANPYRTNTTGVYVYFTTRTPAKITCKINCDGYEEFSHVLYNEGEDNFSKKHEYLLIGCIPDQENRIELLAEDENGDSLGSYTFYYIAPGLQNSVLDIQAEVIEGFSETALEDGLYTLMGNDTIADNVGPSNISVYDNNGVIRSEIPIINYRAQDAIFDEGGMYFSPSGKKMAYMNRLGKIQRLYFMGDYHIHHDYIFGSRNDLLILASEPGETKDDLVLSMNKESGEITKIIDFRELLPNLLAISTKPEGAKVIDWMHFNSIVLVGEDDAVMSSRETSTIMYIENIYEKPSIKYMIGSEKYWEGTGYEKLLLQQVGEFSLQGGQHSVVYTRDESLPEGQYYLEMFNNNNTYSLCRKSYDWSADENYYDTGEAGKSKGNPSWYYKYLVDEKAGTFMLVDEIPVEYGGFVSCIQHVGDNLLVETGGPGIVYEFDRDGGLIQQIRFSREKWIYRIKKFDYKGFWFAK